MNGRAFVTVLPRQSSVHVQIAGRAWLLVTLVSCTTILLASHQVLPAMAGACLLNWVWWANSSRHRHDVPWGGFTYGIGGGLGTLTGMTIAGWWS